MKKILILNLLLAFSCGHSVSQNSWDLVTYHYQTGSVPPPYYYSYDLNINPSGNGTLVYYPNYGKDTSWVYNLTFSQDDINKLSEVIAQSKILDEAVPEDSVRPIGGPLQNISIQLPQDPNLDQVPPRITVPYFPTKEFIEKISPVYSQIKQMVPESIWNELTSRKEEYIKDRENK